MGRKEQKVKLFQKLVELGLAESEHKGRALVMAGLVIVNEQRADKPGQLISKDAEVRIKGQDLYVSRGGFKLLYALEDFKLIQEVKGLSALDVGASTGGFTDCLLQHGAKKVYALDVGTNQLSWKLRNDDRVIPMEKTDIRKIESVIDVEIGLVVADISFNSLARLVPSILRASPSVKMKQ